MSEVIAMGYFALGTALIHYGTGVRGWKLTALGVGVGLIAKGMLS